MPLQLGPRDQSWVALLASTMGLRELSSQRVRLSGRVVAAGEIRVVVQVFGDDVRPLGAAERVVTAAELEAGLTLIVVCEGSARAGRVLAWAEPNARELEFGALTALPGAALAWGEGALLTTGTELHLRSDVAEAA